MKTVLYVDDEKINLTLFKYTFESKYKVICAESGDEALKILFSNDDIEVVISDWKMPVMNGVDFIRKANSLFEDKTYMMLTVLERNDEINRLIKNGLLKSFHAKPFNKKDIEEAIELALENNHSKTA